MIREPLSTTDAPAAIGPYSQAMKAQGTFLFLSGQTPMTPAGDVIMTSIKDQTAQALKNIDNVLKAAGLGPQNVVKTTVFLSSMEHFGAMNEVYGEYFGANPPARSTVAAAGLPKGVDVEIESIAVY